MNLGPCCLRACQADRSLEQRSCRLYRKWSWPRRMPNERLLGWPNGTVGRPRAGAHHPEEIKQEIKTDKSLLDGRPPMDSMSWYDSFATENLTLKRSPHRTVAKDSEYDEELPMRIKQESQLKEEQGRIEQERMEQLRQMQLQPHLFPLPQQWQPSDSKVKDETKPQRAIASVAPTPLSKHEGSADQPDVSPNFQGLPPPSLVPLGLAPAAMSVALSDASPPVLRQSPLPSSYVGGVADVNMMSTSQSRYLAESRPIPHNPEAIRSPISAQVQLNRSRSGSPRTRRDSDSDIEMRQSPSPEPQPEPVKCNEEVHSSSNAMWVNAFATFPSSFNEWMCMNMYVYEFYF